MRPLPQETNTSTELVDSYGLYVPQAEDWVPRLVTQHPHYRATVLAIEQLLVATSHRTHAAYLANILLELNVEPAMVLAGAVFAAVQHEEIQLEAIHDSDVVKLTTSLVRLAQADVVADSNALFLARQSRDHRSNVRHMLIALIDDPRVAVLKLAERLVNLNAVQQSAVHERNKIAKEVLEFYCPLASRLGIWQLKWMLEDLSFSYLYPDDFGEIVQGLNERWRQREKQIAAVCEDLQWRLKHAGISAEVSGRAKNIYGIWRKMKEKNIPFDTVYDVEAVRVIVDQVAHCYSVLGVVHTSWPSIPDAFDDYIANPKGNGYSSIHTAVVGPRGRNLEVQIRTDKMHAEAELGVCAHWAYKNDDEVLKMGKVDWMREVLHWQEEMQDANSAIDISRRLDAPERVYISTPKGHVIDLPAGSTAVDFAYRVHTEIGNHCYGVRINGVDQPLNQPLETGQVVEILTSPRALPRRKWLDTDLGYVRTSRVRKNIQNYFREERPEKNITAGKKWLDEECQRLNLQVNSAELATENQFNTVDEMYIAIAVGDKTVRELLPTNLLQQRAEGLSLLTSVGDKFVQELDVVATDRPRLLLDVTYALALMSVNVLAATIKAPTPGEPAIIHLVVEVYSWEQVRDMINRLRAVQNVIEVKRTDPSSDSVTAE